MTATMHPAPERSAAAGTRRPALKTSRRPARGPIQTGGERRAPADKGVRAQSAWVDALENDARQRAAVWQRLNRGPEPFEANLDSTWRRPASTMAAAHRAPDSPGQPLPFELRPDLEAFFKADLAAVRIHRDAPAAAAAREAHSRAFAAGAHIFFAPGQYRPHDPQGQTLLVHEITHVLQQTARVTHGGALRATDIRGPAAVQRDALFDELVAAYRAEAQRQAPQPSEPSTREQRTRGLETAIGIVRNIIGAPERLTTASGDQPQALLLEQAVLGDAAEEARALAARLDLNTWVVRGFLFDCLKMLGRYAGAAKLLDDHPDDPCFLRYPVQEEAALEAFHSYLTEDAAYGINWVHAAMLDEVNTREAPDRWPYNLLQNLWTYLTRPARRARRAHDYRGLNDAFVARYVTLGFGPNERGLLGLALLIALDNFVYGWMQTLDADTDLGRFSPAMRKRECARRIIQRGMQLQEDPLRFKRDLGRQVQELGQAALAFWDASQRLFMESLGGHGEADRQDPPPDIPILSRFIETVVDQGQMLLHSDTGETPIRDQASYEAHRDAFRGALEGFLGTSANTPQRDSLEHYLEWNLFRYEHVNRASRRDESIRQARWLGWAIRWIENTLRHLDAYDPDADRRFESEHHQPDVRAAHRLQLARVLWGFALTVRDADLEAQTLAIQNGEDLGTSYLLLTGRWEPDPDADIERMNADFVNFTLRGYGLRTAQLVSIYQLLRQRTLNTALQDALLAHEGQVGATQAPLAETVNAAVEAFRMPTRWTHTAFEIVWHREAEAEHPDVRLEDLIEAHPVFIAFAQQRAAARESVIIPRGYRNRVFAWTLPALTPLIVYLRSLTDLNDLVIELAGLSIVISDQRWFEAFVALAEEGMTPEGNQPVALADRRRHILDVLQSGLSANITAANRHSRYLLWRATTHRRRVMVQQLNNVLNEYITGDIRDYARPNQALEAVNSFIFFILPRTDARAQESALVLGLATKLEEMFVRETWLGTVREERYDLITGFYGMVERTIEYARSNGADIRRILFVPENLDEADRQHHRQAGARFESPDALIGNVTHLDRIMQSLNTVITHQQERFGMESVDGDHLKSLQFAHEFAEGDRMEVHGHIYRVTHIARPFRYHPPYGEIREFRMVTPSGQPIPENALILRYVVDTGEEIEVRNRAEDAHHLRRLDDILALAAFLESLANLERVIEEAVELGLDILELVPGVGQGVMAARAIHAVVVFIAEDLPDIRRELFENPQAILEQIGAFINAQLPDFLATLFFGEFPFESRLMAPEDETEEDRPRRAHGQGARLRRLFDFVGDMAEDAMRAFVRLRGRIRLAFVQAQGRIVTQPLLLRVVEALPTLIALGREAVDMAEAFEGIESFDEIEQRLQAEVEHILNGMAQIEIPGDIIPLDLAASVLLNFALSRLPGRKGRVIAAILEAVGAVDQAANLIADALEETPANPNRYWRSTIREALQPRLESAQSALFEAVADLIRSVTGGRINLANPTLETPRVDVDDAVAEREPLSPKLIADTPPETDELPVVNRGGGQALSFRQRDQYLREFGHNFDHVRLHRGPAANTLAEAAHAHALTSGSDIFLSRRIDPQSGPGQSILRHELAHVLQQTGPRPRGGRFDDTSRRHRSQGGLEIDPAREAAADAMARKAERRQAEEEPLTVLGLGGQGLAPTMDAVATDLIAHLTDTTTARSQAEAFEQTVPRRVQRKSTFMSAVQDGRTLWNRIKTKVRAAGSDVHFHAPLNHVSAAVQTYFAGGLNTRVSEHIEGLVLHSIRTRGNGRMELRPRTFSNNLASYLYARSGLVVSLEISTQGRLDDIHFRSLNLAYLHGGTDLWTAMADNTLPQIPAHRRDLFNGRGWGRVRQLIATGLHTAPVWEVSATGGAQFRLSDALIAEVIELLQNLGQVSAKLGTWNDYKNDRAEGSTHMGLRIGTHEEMTRLHQTLSLGGARQSHHIPQYLLIEYFRNNADTELFDNDEDRLPGFYPQRRRNLEYFSTAPGGASRTIDFVPLDPHDSPTSRGDGLPAISLAAVTHQRGRMHINAGGTWGEDTDSTGTPTQGQRLDNVFLDKLQGQGLPRSKREIAASVPDLGPSDLRALKVKIQTAMQQTYGAMYDMMITALPLALRNQEAPYFIEAAMVKHNVENETDLPADFTPQHVATATSDTRAAMASKNDTIMREWQ